MSKKPIVLPIATIQTDFKTLMNDVLNGLVPEDSFWLSCYKTGEQSVHGKVHLGLNEQDRNTIDYNGVGGVQFAKEAGNRYMTTCASLGIESIHLAIPSKSYSDFLPRTQNASYHAISAFDVAPDGSQFAAGYGDGSVYIVPTAPGSPSATSTSKPHLSAVTSVQFFPSSRVLLSAGVDFALNILSAEHSTSSTSTDLPRKVSPVRTLKGHSRAITSTTIVSRGRNILSGGKDGTVRLWDVSSGAQIRMMGTKGYLGVLSMGTGDRAATVFDPPLNRDGDIDSQIPLSIDPREVDTGDKVVFCGLSDGTVEAFDLSTKLSVFHSKSGMGVGPVHSLAYDAEHSLLAAGSSTGVVEVFDTRSLSYPLVTFQRNSASVEDVAFLSFADVGVGLAIATEDGLPYIAHIQPEGPSVHAELVGPDCDAVRCVRLRTGEIWTAGDDGTVRRYDGLST